MSASKSKNINRQEKNAKSPQTRLKKKIFQRTLALLAILLTLSVFAELTSLVIRERDKQYREIEQLVEQSTEYVAHAAWQVNPHTLSLVMQSIITTPQAKISAYQDADIEVFATKKGFDSYDWTRCDKIFEVDLTGFMVEQNPLPSGNWRVCYVNTYNVIAILREFLFRIPALLVLSLLLAFLFSRMVNNFIVSPVQKLSRHIAQQQPLDTYQRARNTLERDEFDDLVDELKNRTRELRREQQLIEQFFPEISDAVVQVDRNFQILRYNHAFETLVGESQLGNKKLTEFFEEDLIGTDDERKEITSDDKRIIEVRPSALRDDNGRIYLFRDVTSERKKQDQDMHAAKLRALGTLAGGIAHDYNNLLAIIISNAEILATNLDEVDEQQDLIDNMIHAASRGASLSKQLLTFARKGNVSMTVVNANQIAENVFRVVHPIIGRMQQINLSLSSKWQIEIDTGLIESALMNLIVNAKDALPKGGTITIAVEDNTYADKNYVVFSIHDNGVGMSKEVIERVCDPFFTTKSLGKGTGLGLSIVSSFAEQFGGYLDIESQPNQGTVVSLYIPRFEGKASPQISQDLLTNNSDIAPRKILIMDDEVSLCKILAMLLTREGHIVTTSTSYEDFSDRQLYKENYDLVVCDVQLERETAYDVWIAFKQANNTTEFSLISGNIPDEVLKEINEIGTEHLLIKPFHNQDFTTFVNNILQRKQDKVTKSKA